MARDDSKARLRPVALTLLDGARPSTARGWVNPVAPVVVQAVTGAGHWAAGRRQRALAEWAGAAGFGLMAWGLGTEAPALAEVEENLQRQLSELARTHGGEVPATAGTETPGARRLSQFFLRYGVALQVAVAVLSVPWRLRQPRRLTVLAVATEAPNAAFNVVRAARAVQQRRPKMAVGSALIAAGSLGRLRAASAEPIR